MLNLIQSDLFKMRKSMAVKISFFITTLCAIFFILIAQLLATGTLGMDVAGNAALLSDAVTMSIIGSVIAGIFICSDFENKTINAAISSGYGRLTIVVSKAIVYFIIMGILLLPYAIATIVSFICGFKFGSPFIASTFLDILFNKSGLEFSATVFFKMILIMFIITVVHVGRISICILFAFLLKKPALVVGAGIGIGMVCDLIVGTREKLGLFGNLLYYTPFAQGYKVVTMTAGSGTLLKAVVCSLIFIAIILAITYSIFRKTEVK